MIASQFSLAECVNNLGDSNHRAAQEYVNLIQQIKQLRAENEALRNDNSHSGLRAVIQRLEAENEVIPALRQRIERQQAAIHRLEAENETLKEQLSSHQKLAAKGIYYTNEELLQARRNFVLNDLTNPTKEVESWLNKIRAKAGRDGYIRCAKDFGLTREGTYQNGWNVYQLANFYANQIETADKGE